MHAEGFVTGSADGASAHSVCVAPIGMTMEGARTDILYILSRDVWRDSDAGGTGTGTVQQNTCRLRAGCGISVLDSGPCKDTQTHKRCRGARCEG